MAQAAGKVGTVLTINVNGDVVVQFGQRYWIFNPESCTPAPGSSVDFIPADSSDGLLEGLERHLDDLLPSDEAVLDAASSPQLRGLFTAIKEEDATKVAKLLDDCPGLVRESALEATALHYAAFKGNVEAVRLLVAKGADINKGDKEDDTPLIRAVHRKRTEAARALIELGADVNLSNENGQTPLHSAVITNSIDIVRLLLHNMASVNRRDLQGDTPLFDAMQVDNLDPAILDILLATGDLDLRVVNKRGFNALLMAAMRGRPRAVERILARDSSLLTSVVEEGRYTALHIACANNHVDVIKVLVQAKAPLDARSHVLATPLHLACSEDHLMSARILVENGADINAVDVNWDTPLHECFSESKNPASQLLGTSARGPNKGLELAKFLLQHGARHFLRNRQGKTALDVAPESVREKLTSFLSQPREAAAATTAKPPAPPEAPGKMANNENGSSSAKCATCHQREADVIFLPCAHKLVCRQCAGSTKSCRECGADVKGKVDTKGKPVQEKPSEATPDTKSSASHQKIKVGDTVRITADVNRLEQNQANHGGWTEDMTQAAGKVGKVMSLTPTEDLVVQFGQQFWVFNADSCIPAPGSTPDFIASNELSNRENNLRGELNSPSPGLLGKDLGRLMEDATAFLNGPSRLKDLFKAIVSDDQREMAALLDKEPELVNATVVNSTAVHFAAYSGRVGAIRLLVGRGASVNMRDNNMDSPLCRAIQMRRMEAARVLLELGADVNQQNTKGLAPLHLAVIVNSLDITRLLLQNMASVNVQDLKGNSPLLIAIEKNDTDQAIVEALLAKGDLDLRLTNQQGFNALHRAALRDKPRTVSAILARDQSLVTTVITDGKFTALHIAAANNHTDVIKILLRAHAAIDARDHTSQTPLHLASSEDYLESSRILVENGADINAVDAQRNTPLHLCFEMNLQMLLGKGPSREKKGAEVAKFLIQRGARTDIRNAIGQLALEKAPEPVRRQLEALKTSNAVPQPTRNQNADQSFGNTGAPKNDDGDSTQCTMCHQREADVIFLPCAHKLVCRQCAQSTRNCRQCGQAINMKVDTKGKPLGKAPSPSTADNTKPAGLQNEQLTDLTGKDLGDVLQAAMGFLTSPSPLQDLFHAVQSEQTAKVTEMIEREPSLLEQTVAGANALHFAALNGKPEAVRILVAKGADIDKGDMTGDSPLMRSIHTNQLETARVLLELGADVNRSNLRGLAPLHVAVALNHTEMVLLLLRNKASVNKQEPDGNTPLHAGLGGDGVSDTILDALVAAEDLDLKLTTNQQATPFHTAVHFNRTRVMQKILARDSSLVNVPMDEGFTPLHLAAQNNRVEAMRILLKARAHVNAREEAGRTPLHVACASDYMESARVLVENGADVNAADSDGHRPLHTCVGYRTTKLPQQDKGLELAKYLIQHGARTDARDNRGRTPLDMAPNQVEDKLKRFLRERGLLPDKKQNDDDISNTPSASPSSPSDKCVACHQHQADVILLPCAHKLVCRQCAGSTKSCRECGTEVVRRVDTEGKSVDASSSSSAAVSGEEDAGNQVQECKVQ